MDFNALSQELSALVATVWPDIVREGNRYLREEEHVNTIPFDELVDQGLPYAVLVIPEPEDFELGLCTRSYLFRMEAWWVGETDKGSETHRERAEALASALRTASLTNGQVWDDPDPRPVFGARLPINEILRGMKLDVLAGGVRFSVVTSEADE